MVTIKSGENALLRFTVKNEAGAIIPTSAIASFSVALVYQPCGCDGSVDDEEILGTWTYIAPSEYSTGMQSAGDGIFEIEVLPSQTSKPGILTAIVTVHFLDAAFFVTGSEVLVTIHEDALEILEVPSTVIKEIQFFISDDDFTGIADDDGTLISA